MGIIRAPLSWLLRLARALFVNVLMCGLCACRAMSIIGATIHRTPVQKDLFRTWFGNVSTLCTYVFTFYLMSFICFLASLSFFFSSLSQSLVWALMSLIVSLWFLSGILPSPFVGLERGGGDAVRRLPIVSSLEVSFRLPGTWGFSLTSLVATISCLREVSSCSPACDDLMGQGNTSQSKCMCAATWGRAWCWGTEEPERPNPEKSGGDEAWDWWARM